jgi:inosine-uridine nucleoside N-ribohydrolase
MATKKVWLDCDPGHDDMLAIIMAALSGEIELIGVSTSSGNSFIENTTQNALNILYEIGREDIQVVKGASRPLCGKLETAAEIHGASGLEGAELLKSPKSAIEEKPFLHIYNEIMAQNE